MTKRDYQMFWDCAYCGTKELLGVSHRHCPNCGGAQDETCRYFPPYGKEVELHNHKYYGVDWDCKHCSTPNSKASHNCINCGSPQEGAVDVDLVDKPKYQNKKQLPNPDKEQSFANMSAGSSKKERFSLSSEWNTPGRNKMSYYGGDVSGRELNNRKDSDGGDKTFKIVAIFFGFLFAVLMAFLVYGNFKITEHNVDVVDKLWQRSIEVQEYQRVSRTEWCSSMDSDAYNVTRFRDVRSHRQVADGQTCSTERRDKGDGSYSTQRICHTKYRSEPVYDYRCNYTVNRWRYSHSVTSSGSGDSKPKDPDVSHIRVNNSNILGNLRLGSKSESYKVVFNYVNDNEVEVENCTYSQTTWTDFTLKKKYKGKVRMIGGLICQEVAPLENPVANTKDWSGIN